jgi:hypothetical protein
MVLIAFSSEVLKRESGVNPELTRSGKRERGFIETLQRLLWEVKI